jgi:hypothetical protein
MPVEDLTAIQLLLSHADDHQPALAEGLVHDAFGQAAAPVRVPLPEHLLDRGGDPNDLPSQRWALIVPEGDAGRRLEALVQPLVALRRAEQGGHDVRVYRMPPRMDAAAAIRWHSEVYLDKALPNAEIPFYQLILGDLDQVPLALQQVQMLDGVVGRLAFADDRGYEAYVAKLLAWERAPSPIARARSMFYTAHDGTAATTLGYQALVAPGLAIARKDRDSGEFPASDIVELGQPGRLPTPDDLVADVGAADPAVLMTVSHGDGAPRAGWASLDAQHRLQGAMSFGKGGKLTADDLAARRFLPGGIWMMFACFGAGTPDDSAYRPWLERLRQLGAFGGAIEPVLRSLPAAGQPPFIAALPRALLANPDGPIAFIGHIDLAWSYSFQELDAASGPINRPRRFTSLLHHALRRDRVGVAFRELVGSAINADVELATLYGNQAQRAGAMDPAQLTRLGHLWMLRHDLLGYVLLGDPAARLPITPAVAAARLPIKPAVAAAPRPVALREFFSFPVGEPPKVPPPIPPTPVPAVSPPVSPASIERLEAAILQLLVGQPVADAAVQQAGVDRAELERLAAIYRAAGRAVLAGGKPDP